MCVLTREKHLARGGTPRDLPQGLQGRPSIHAAATENIYGRGVDLVDDRVDRQVSRKVLVLLEHHSGLSGGFECERARVVRGTGCFQVNAQGLRRPGQAADCSRQPFRCGTTGLYHGERGAGERPYVADGQVYLVGCSRVEFEVPEASSPGRSEPRSLTAGHYSFFQATDPRVDLLGLQVSSLDPLGIT